LPDADPTPSDRRNLDRLRRRAVVLEWWTNGWNAIEVVVTITLGLAARSLALVAFGLDSLVEVFASTVVIWDLRGEGAGTAVRSRRALLLIAGAFAVLAAYLVVASIRSLVGGNVPEDSPLGIAYLAVTGTAMFTLSVMKRRLAEPLDSQALRAEAAMTLLDGCLCVAILAALVVNTVLGWWWADGLAALVIAAFAAREGVESWREARGHRSRAA
jgi:divalent metal cation (Fe/Co/Zn/Cd) transporter